MFAIRNRHSRGLGLAETLLVCLIFAIITTLCVTAVTTGFRMFNQTNVRQSLQRDASAVFAWMQRDVESSNLTLDTVDERTVGTDRRDRFGISGLGSWAEPIKVDGLGHPAWDRVIVYEATREAEGGQILRKVNNVSSALLPLTSAGVLSIMTDVSSNFDVRRLAGGVRVFEAAKSVPLENLKVRLILSQRTSEVGVNKKRNEVLEVQSSIRPRNNFPRL